MFSWFGSTAETEKYKILLLQIQTLPSNKARERLLKSFNDITIKFVKFFMNAK